MPRRLRCEQLEDRRLLAGVTLITHGFGGNIDGWVATLADAIAERAAPSEQPRYVIRVTDPGAAGGPLEVTNPTRSGPDPTSLDTFDPEIMVLLDWSDVAGSFPFPAGVRSTFDVAAAVAEVFATPDFLGDLAAPLAELPLHLIGHSRGGSLVGELARELGELGIWVDQVTTLDPHPVDGVRDPLGTDFGDAPISPSESVVFWDNYWRTDGDTSLDFTGEPVGGAHDVQLDEAVLNNFGGYFNEHSDAHLWYHGTVDTTGPIDDGTESVAADAGWYAGEMGPRDEIGYYFSRIGGGPRPEDGIAETHGGSGVRVPIADSSDDHWPSLTQLTVVPPTVLEIGELVEARYFWHDRDGDGILSMYLDHDLNPFNGRGRAINQTNPGATITNSVKAGIAPLDTHGVQPGDYYLLAAIEDGEHTRFAYAAELITLVAPPVIALDNNEVLGNVIGAEVGSVTVIDPLATSHSLVVGDPRFEIVGDRLRLDERSSLPGNVAGTVTVQIIATATEDPSRTFSQSIVLSITPNPLPWQNAANRLDVNNDGFVSPIDALTIINELNDRMWIDATTGRVPSAFDPAAFYYDTTGDNFVVPLDVLHVINAINEQIAAQSEGAFPLYDSRLEFALRDAPLPRLHDEATTGKLCNWLSLRSDSKLNPSHVAFRDRRRNTCPESMLNGDGLSR